ncbi:MAG: hypothetical protein HY907_07090 [Deltaproteobacteria bacterium]|nr:hypothetical protein [Deltaproteobacteria bacterium]
MSVPEPGGPDPSGFERAALRLLLCRLSTAAQVQASVTHRALLWAARGVPGVYGEVAYRPPREPRGAEPPGWVGSASGRPARGFDVLGITLTVVQEALNLPRLLRASGIPLAGAARAADPSCPLVLLGGHSAPVATFLHGAVDDAGGDGLVDAVAVGDGLGALREVLSIVAESRARGAARGEVLEELARRVSGLYVPAWYEHVHRGGRLEGIRARRPAHDPLPMPVPRRDDPPEAWRGYDGAFLPWTGEAGEETLPVAFGCPHRCRFCRDGWAMGPHRQTSPELVVEIARRMKAALAATDLNLLSPDLGCQRGLFELLRRLLQIYPRLSAKSLAGISFVRSPALAALLPRLGKRELTVGVEGMSARLREWLGKRFDAGLLPELLGPMHRGGLRQAKLFFIATGLETDADLGEASELFADIARAAPRLRVLASAMPLFPAPGTPLGFAPLRDVREALRRLEEAARGAGAEFRVSASAEEIRAATLLCRAGRAATPALVRASIEDRIAYDGELRVSDASRIVRRLAAEGLDTAALSGEIPARAVCPWDDLELGVSRRVLRREYERTGAGFGGEGSFRAEAQRRRGEGKLAGESGEGGWHGQALLARASGPAAGIPDPFAERVRRALSFRVEGWAAEAPGVTLARGALREWFLRDEAAATAFAGIESVLAVDGTSGLRVVVAEFAASFGPGAVDERSKERSVAEATAGAATALAVPARPVALLSEVPVRPWFEAFVAGDDVFAVLRRIVEGLRPAVRHRVDRTAAGRRLLVDKGFWNRCGLAAARVEEGGLRVYVSPAGEVLARELAAAGVRLECVALLDSEPPAKCPTCGHPVFTRHDGEGKPSVPVCAACGESPLLR